MKNKIFVLFVLCFTFSAMLKAQELYYWSDSKKHFLEEDKRAIILTVKDVEDIDALINDFQRGISVKSMNVARSGKIAYFRTADDISDLEKFQNENPLIKSIAFGLKYENDEYPMFPTGELLLQPKSNVDISEIVQLITDKYENYEPNKYGNYKISINSWSETLPLANRIYESGLVNYCHPNFKAPIEKMQLNPTDPLYPQQYYLNQNNNIDINAPEAWTLSRGLSPVRVAVIDDGVEAHEDLNGRVLAGFTPTDPNGFGAPANPPWPDNIFPFTPLGHGQACAGIIGATHDNVGIAGVFPCAQIIPVNIFNDWFIDFNNFGEPFVNYNEEVEDLRDAIDWAWDEGKSDVLSNSWGFINQGANFDAITFAINRARTLGRGGLGSIVVFSSGNSNQSFSGVTFPANVSGVITVGAINQNGNIWNYSSRGSQMDLVAPSGNTGGNGNVVTTDRMGNLGYDPGNYTFNFGGTSAAAPQVSGVAALMISVNPNLTESQVRTILQQTATDMGPTGFDNTFGYGRLNAEKAVKAALPNLTGPTLVCTSNSTFNLSNVPAGASVSWSKSSNLNQVAANNNSITVKAANSISSGNGWVKASITTDCGSYDVQQDFWVDKANVDSVSFSNGVGQSGYFCSSHNGNFYSIFPKQTGVTHQIRLK